MKSSTLCSYYVIDLKILMYVPTIHDFIRQCTRGRWVYIINFNFIFRT